MKFKEFLIGYGLVLSEKNQESQSEILSLLSVFCNTHRETVREWLRGKQVPRGVAFIKLQEAFVAAGYPIDEYEKLSPTLKQCAQLLVYRTMCLDVMAEMAGYHRKDGFLRLFTGNRRAFRGTRPPNTANVRRASHRFRSFTKNVFNSSNRYGEIRKVGSERGCYISCQRTAWSGNVDKTSHARTFGAP